MMWKMPRGMLPATLWIHFGDRSPWAAGARERGLLPHCARHLRPLTMTTLLVRYSTFRSSEGKEGSPAARSFPCPESSGLRLEEVEVRWGSTRCWGCSTTTACNTGPASERAPELIGRITLGVKRTGKRRTGNPFAPFDVAGAGDGLTANLHGHEAGNGGYSQGAPTGHRASPRPYYAPGPSTSLACSTPSSASC